jgi:uncharacterized protein YbjQ (UPF0145 family)
MMKRNKVGIALVLLAVTGVLPHLAIARDSVANHAVAEALDGAEGKEKVHDDVALYFGDQRHASVEKSFGEVATNKKTNAFGKSDEEACRHVFLSAVLELQDNARRQGGNAVINIRSNYHNDETSSPTDYACGAGAVIAGVALKGEVVRLRR